MNKHEERIAELKSRILNTASSIDAATLETYEVGLNQIAIMRALIVKMEDK
jgi:hypothetical protein